MCDLKSKIWQKVRKVRACNSELRKLSGVKKLVRNRR